MNPVIYGIFNRQFRDAFQKVIYTFIWKCCRIKNRYLDYNLAHLNYNTPPNRSFQGNDDAGSSYRVGRSVSGVNLGVRGPVRSISALGFECSEKGSGNNINNKINDNNKSYNSSLKNNKNKNDNSSRAVEEFELKSLVKKGGSLSEEGSKERGEDEKGKLLKIKSSLKNNGNSVVIIISDDNNDNIKKTDDDGDNKVENDDGDENLCAKNQYKN